MTSIRPGPTGDILEDVVREDGRRDGVARVLEPEEPGRRHAIRGSAIARG